MEPLILKASDDTPAVCFDNIQEVFEISGKSMPEDVTMFYEPLLNWLDNYANCPNASTILKMKLEYFNTASSKLLLDVLMKFEDIHSKNNSVQVQWFYPKTDEEMKEAGEEYADMVDLPFEYIVF